MAVVAATGCVAPGLLRGQAATATPAGAHAGDSGEARPLPDVAALMHSVETKQRAVEAAQQEYIYRSAVVETETDGKGRAKKTETRDYDIFWLQGVPVQKLVAKNGKPVSADDLKKEDDRIDKEVQKARERRAKNDAVGKQTDPRGDEEITVSRMLELGSFRNARRVNLNGRDAIAVDYVGDPRAKTRNRAESAFRDLEGTVWVDETDHEVVQVEGHFARSFKIAGGLLADIQEGTRFSLRQAKINGSVWLPTGAEASGAARLLVFSVHGGVRVTNSDFRRFKTSARILPEVNKVEEPK